MTTRRFSVVRGLTVVVTIAFLSVLGYYLSQPGYSETRLAFFAILGGLAILGTAGVIYQRELVAAGAACSLGLLGFWQAALWMYIFAVVGMLVVASLVIARGRSSNSPSVG